MAIGPVQLLVLRFNHPDFHGEIIEELERLRESDTVRVIDALAVHKDAEGEIEVGALAAADGVEVFSEEQAWDVLADIPDDSAAALLLIEHHWAVRYATRSSVLEASASATASSARWTSSRSGCCRPRTPRTCTPWRRPQPPEPGPDGQDHHDQEVTRMFGSAESRAGPLDALPGASTAAAAKHEEGSDVGVRPR
jgi:hypothetical protein